MQIFDPLNMSDGANPKDIKKWREAEIKHGRVAMLASLGVLVAEVSDTRPLPYFYCCAFNRDETRCNGNNRNAAYSYETPVGSSS